MIESSSLSALLLGGSLGIRKPTTLPSVTMLLNLSFFSVEVLMRGNCSSDDVLSTLSVILLHHGHEAASGVSTAQVKHALVHVVHVLLLRAKDGAGTRDTDPANEGGGRESEVLHAIESDQGACASQSRLAMDSNGAALVFRRSQELRYNIIRGSSAISEKEVEMLNTLLSKFALLVLRLVKANNECHTKSLPDGYVVIWGE